MHSSIHLGSALYYFCSRSPRHLLEAVGCSGLLVGFAMVQVPLQFPAPERLQEVLSPNVLIQRENSVMAVTKWKGQLDLLVRIDVLKIYGSSLYELVSMGKPVKRLGQELIVCLVDAAFLYREVSLDVMQGAYGSKKTDGAWSTGGSYMRMGLGLLQFTANWLLSPSGTLSNRQDMCILVEDMTNELQLLQQLGIVVLSLSKLRAKFYKDQKDAVLDFQAQDLEDLATNSILYTKLVIGCMDTAYKCKQGPTISDALFAYLNSLSFLLLSLDQYQRDECGVAVGMIEHAVKYVSRLVSKSQLDDPLLSETRKRDVLKHALNKKPFPHGSGAATDGPIAWMKRNKGQALLPLLQETLDDFLLPLIFLLRYRYRQTNDKISFQPVENDETKLRRLFPRGKAPDVHFGRWSFDQRTRTLVPEPQSSSGGYY